MLTLNIHRYYPDYPGRGKGIQMGNNSMSNMSMSDSAKHMGASLNHLSWIFAVVIIVISASLIGHMWMMFWNRRMQLLDQDRSHISSGNHLSMAVGMVSGLTMGATIGGLSATHIFLAYTIGLFIGSSIGLITGIPFKHLGMLDGMISGLMGGLMGVMIGTMLSSSSLYWIIIFLMLPFLVTWGIIVHFIRARY